MGCLSGVHNVGGVSHICNVGSAGSVSDVCTAGNVGCAGSVIGVSIEHDADNVGSVDGVRNVGSTCRLDCLACSLKANHDLWLFRVAIS